MRILSCGLGVNSMALIAGKSKGLFDIDYAIFADTGSEMPETYEYLEKYALPFCNKIGLTLAIVKSDLYPLKEYYENKSLIPTRIFRHCTDKFKVRPINQYCAEHFKYYDLVLGIAAEEKDRAKNWNCIDYPLVTHGIDRDGCKELIREVGLPIPHKSGCYFCPFMPRHGWIELLKNHRELYLEAEKFEKNCRRYPDMTLTTMPLEKIREKIDNQCSLVNWIEPQNTGCVLCEVNT